MIYALEHLTLQGPEHPQRCQWKQYAFCANKALLERIRLNQPHPEEWRVRLSVQQSKRKQHRRLSMEQKHYFPPLYGGVDCGKCEVQNCWCRGNTNGTGVI